MSITVSQLCKLPLFKEGFRLISNPGEGLNRGVQNVTVMEVPDFVEFELGEELFVLTTLYSFRDDLDLACTTLQKLCQKNVSAIGVKVDRFVHAIPKGIIDIADQYHVPLFTIEKFVAFRDVIKTISAEIINEQYRSQEHQIKIEIEQRMIAEIVDEILIHQHNDESVIIERLKFLGIIPENYYFITIANFHDLEGQASLSTIQDFYGKLLKNEFSNCAVFMKGNKLLTIVSVKKKSHYLQPEAIRKALLKLTEEAFIKKGSSVYLGYSAVIEDLKLLPQCYEQTKKALKFGIIFKPQTKVHSYSDFIKEGLLVYSIGTYEHQEITKTIITPILEYDQKYNTELWYTLDKCLDLPTLEKAALELHIHPSTLRYRLEKIYTLSGADYFNPEGRFILKLANLLAKLSSN